MYGEKEWWFRNNIANIITNIKDKKKLFNLGNNVDCLLNDCVGEKIRVVEVLLKTYAKPMKEPLIDEETGEVIKDTEFTMSTVLVETPESQKRHSTRSLSSYKEYELKFVETIE